MRSSAISSGAGAYQPYVDGLRAIAILSVVLGHVGIPGFAGGFVGVDIFFVISGYLIIGQIAEALRRGTFSFAGFWAKRVLRIMPPMLAMLIACLAIAPFVLVTPEEFREFKEQFLFTALMTVNFYFLDTQGYFDTDAILKPLLHMWSLAVEEQFYLLTPLALYAGWRWRARAGYAIPVAVTLLFALSLASSIALSDLSKNIAFYVVLCRAWEFIAGGALIYLQPRIAGLPHWALNALSLAGLLAIAASIIFFTETSPFPSYLAVLPVAGTAMVIAAGLPRVQIPALRVLGSWPFTAVGLVSYSWYLWHWPLLSFGRIHNFGQTDLRRDGLAVLVAFAAAIATYFLIERPSRAVRQSPSIARIGRPVAFGGVLGTIAVSLGATLYGQSLVAAAERAIPEAMRPEKNTKLMRGDPCWLTDPDVLPAGCADAIGKKKVVVLVGDSHARMLYPALKLAADRRGMALVSLWRTGCSPFTREPATLLDPKGPKCDNYAPLGLRTLQKELPAPPEAVIVGGYWSRILYGVDYSEHRRSGGAAERAHLKERSEQFAASIAALLDSIRGAGVKRAVIVGPSAEFVRLPVECVARANAEGLPQEICNSEKRDLEHWLAPAISILRGAVQSRPDAMFVDAMDVFCPGEACQPTGNGTMYFSDTHHVSPEGAERILAGTELRSVYGVPAGKAEPALLQ